MSAVIGADIDKQIGPVRRRRDERFVGLLHLDVMADNGYRIVPVEPQVTGPQGHQDALPAKRDLPVSVLALIGAISEDLGEALMEQRALRGRKLQIKGVQQLPGPGERYD